MSLKLESKPRVKTCHCVQKQTDTPFSLPLVPHLPPIRFAFLGAPISIRYYNVARQRFLVIVTPLSTRKEEENEKFDAKTCDFFSKAAMAPLPI